MKWIAEQPYYKVERVMSSVEQKTVVYERTMYLYQDKLVTQHREFDIQNIFDISYRKLGADEGILYLHTKQGVFTYSLKADPSLFIKEYKGLNSNS
ncbi:hypothetical protein [Paenibacillus marinisediminis]